MSDQPSFDRPNPLLDEVPRYSSIEEIASKLAYDPLAKIEVDRLSLLQRDELLVCKKEPLLPTMLSLKTALSIIGMHRSSCRLRIPTLASGRRRVNLAIDAVRQAGLAGIPPVPGACVLVVKGVTGAAKTVTVKRTLKLLGEQVIHHGAVDAALWKQAVQLNYLFTAMSHDGSRGGFLNNILIAVDQALGTTYSIDLPRQYKSVERLAGATVALLHTLYLGVLVIDEIQLGNLVLSEHAPKMHLLLLNLINSGIPVVLVGNPYGFAWLSALSQDASRMVEREQAFFHPCGATDDADEWDTVFDGVRKYFVLPEAPGDIAECKVLLKRLSGGIPRIALAIWCIAQRAALLDGHSSIGAADLAIAYRKDTFDDIRDVCDGFAQRDPIKLMRWRDQDIPVDYYARLWGAGLPTIGANEEQAGKTVPPSPPTPRVKATRGHAAALLRAQRSRERKKQAARDHLTQTLADEDMRKEGLTNHALASLSALMAAIEHEQHASDS